MENHPKMMVLYSGEMFLKKQLPENRPEKEQLQKTTWHIASLASGDKEQALKRNLTTSQFMFLVKNVVSSQVLSKEQLQH